MPLTAKGEKIMSAMVEKYGAERGKEVFYKSKNAGTISGVDEGDAAVTPSSLQMQVDALTDKLAAADRRISVLDEGEKKEEWGVGQKVHLGFGARGGAGFYGTITKLSGASVEIKNPQGKTYKGPTSYLSKGDDDDCEDAQDDRSSQGHQLEATRLRAQAASEDDPKVKAALRAKAETHEEEVGRKDIGG